MNSHSHKGPNGRLTKDSKAKLFQLRANGKKIHEIAREMGVSQGTVWRYVKGIPAGGTAPVKTVPAETQNAPTAPQA